ncbi:MAG: tRNA lysidine(34) synthetase TilS [Bacteroidia bacterium]|nr:MAG: tRNA lysidine(34) synthetase TilS [Bacteroidia bacterium]
MNLTKEVQKFIERHSLFESNSKILVAISGGADSIALAHLLARAGYSLLLAHCNFGLRGKDSDADEQYVSEFAKKMNLPFFCKRFSPEDFLQRKKMSVEEAAREMRYAWFEKLRREQKCDRIATGHHLNDAIETFFINLTAGTGIRGLKSIPVKNGYIVRPVLCAKRADIEAYCQKNELDFRTDNSNFDSVFVRNKFRHTLLPLFSQINPAFEDTMIRNLNIFREIHNVYSEWIQEFSKKIISHKDDCLYIAIQKLEQSTAPQSVLFEVLHPYGFNGKQCEEILRNLKGRQSGKIFHSKSHKLLKDRDFLIVKEKKETGENSRKIYPKTPHTDLPVKFKIETVSNTLSNIDFKDKNVAYFNPELLDFPLTLRTARAGDRFHPFGMKGRKLVSDFYTDIKLNQFEKENTYLLLSGGKIAWIVGLRTDDRFKITPQCKEVIRIERLPD